MTHYVMTLTTDRHGFETLPIATLPEVLTALRHLSQGDSEDKIRQALAVAGYWRVTVVINGTSGDLTVLRK